jgi:hypothetical protein
VYVSDSLDQVELQFEVAAGPYTTLNITKEYITKLRKEHPGLDPALVAWGGIQMYDVDGECIKFSADQNNHALWRYLFRPYDHLKERGLLHLDLGGNEQMELGGSARVQEIYVMS